MSKFIEDCCKYIESLEEIWDYFRIMGYELDYQTDNNWYHEVFGEGSFSELTNEYKVYIIQVLLSRAPDGQAVMPFLDVDLEVEEKNIKYVRDSLGNLICIPPKTLDHLLYREFTKALRVGKSFDEALEIVDEIYKYYAK